MNLGIIKNEETYERTLAEIGNLIDDDPSPETSQGRRLELLSLLVENYEQTMCSNASPSPVEAIRFRMEQQNLSPTDLIPFIGSRGKVSEVLSGKRTLSLSMVRALHSGLGIPAASLIQEQTQLETEIEWDRFPVKEMVERGWINAGIAAVKKEIHKYLSEFFGNVGGPEAVAALYRRSERSGRPMNKYALAAWTVRVMTLAQENPPETPFRRGTVTLEIMQEIARLSPSATGPLEARDFLRNIGISLVIEASLPKTYLDGAAIISVPEHPIIGLSLRYDRIDNFWFCLMHELAHISLHSEEEVKQFYDDLDVKKSDDPQEEEADKFAGEALIPSDIWKCSPVPVARSKESIIRLAGQLSIHPAIIAGRLRRELNSYHVFNDLIGHGHVRHLFFE